VGCVCSAISRSPMVIDADDANLMARAPIGSGQRYAACLTPNPGAEQKPRRGGTIGKIQADRPFAVRDYFARQKRNETVRAEGRPEATLAWTLTMAASGSKADPLSTTMATGGTGDPFSRHSLVERSDGRQFPERGIKDPRGRGGRACCGSEPLYKEMVMAGEIARADI